MYFKKFFKNRFYKIFTGIFSIFLILSLYKKLDFSQLKLVIHNSNLLILFISLSISLFLGIIGGWRFYFCSKFFGFRRFPSLKTSSKSYFVTSLINLALPSKLGDLTKGYICNRIDKENYDFNIHLYTIYEKLSDLLAIVILGYSTNYILHLKSDIYIYQNRLEELVTGKENLLYIYLLIMIILFLILCPIKKIIKFKFGFKNFNLKIFPKLKLFKIIEKLNLFKYNLSVSDFIIYQIISILIWIIHLFQICLFAEALQMNLWSYSGIFIIITTILFSLLPISFAGVGTRDALILYLLSPIYGNIKPLFLGVLMTLRYIIPAVFGALFLSEINLRIKNIVKIF